MPAALSHEVSAYNLSANSENQIHDDAVAQRFGFQGGLVPGVEIYAYMTNLPVRYFGTDWLSVGTAECRFLKPVYDGRIALASASVKKDGALAMKVESEGVLCGSGIAAMRQVTTAPDISAYATAALPDYDTRPDATPKVLVEGQVMGTFETAADAEELSQYLKDVREDLPIYTNQRIVHPGWLLRLANRALSMNVKLGPWIHVGSRLENFATSHYGDLVEARATISRQYEHKGHRFVELDVLLIANGKTILTRVDHTAIYQPRQVAAVA